MKHVSLRALLILACLVFTLFKADAAYAIANGAGCYKCTYIYWGSFFTVHCLDPDRNTYGYTSCSIDKFGTVCNPGGDLCYYIEVRPR